MASNAYFTLNQNDMKSQLLNYTNTCEIKTFFKINTTGSSLFEGYFQCIHHPGSEETISLSDLLLASDSCQRKGEEKAAVNIDQTMPAYGIEDNDIHEKKNPMCSSNITQTY